MNFKVYKNKNTKLKLISKKLVLILVLLLSFQNAFCQDEEIEIISHKVALGETMLTISKKYLVSPTEIYRLNKKAIDGISEGMILYIPQPVKSQEIIAERKEKREKEKLALLERKKEREEREQKELEEVKQAEAKNTEVLVVDDKNPEYGRREAISKLNISDKKHFIDHEVASGETLNSLSKRYGVSVEEIEAENQKVLKKGLQAGTTLKMPVAKNLFINNEPDEVVSTISSENKNSEKTEITHKVTSGETLYSISRKYDVTLDEIKNENVSVLKNGLQTGEFLKIKTSKAVTINEYNNDNEVVTDNASLNEFSVIKHHVEPKETLYSISRKYNVSVEEIKQQNEAVLSKGLQSGQDILIKVKK
ncbi:LysM peptidoglycan-binding domain-containing protein [Flavobacterium ponti]|uniref:LysM peptidoglycan-binding domain-containing protein n=1 Tax=Flavobacterium ponti TaxID=665133 RepID=A0ABV9P6S1_9FLAO